MTQLHCVNMTVAYRGTSDKESKCYLLMAWLFRVTSDLAGIFVHVAGGDNLIFSLSESRVVFSTNLLLFSRRRPRPVCAAGVEPAH